MTAIPGAIPCSLGSLTPLHVTSPHKKRQICAHKFSHQIFGGSDILRLLFPREFPGHPLPFLRLGQGGGGRWAGCRRRPGGWRWCSPTGRQSPSRAPPSPSPTTGSASWTRPGRRPPFTPPPVGGGGASGSGCQGPMRILGQAPIDSFGKLLFDSF